MEIDPFKAQIAETFAKIRKDFEHSTNLMNKQESSCYHTIATQSILLEKGIFSGQFINDKKFNDIADMLEVMYSFKIKLNQERNEKISLTQEKLEEKRNKLEQLKYDFDMEFTSFLKWSEDEEDRETAEEKFAVAKATLDEAVEIIEGLSEDTVAFPNGLYTLPSDLRWESNHEYIVRQFEDIDNDISIALENIQMHNSYGTKINIDFDAEDQNLTAVNKTDYLQNFTAPLKRLHDFFENIKDCPEYKDISSSDYIVVANDCPNYNEMSDLSELAMIHLNEYESHDRVFNKIPALKELYEESISEFENIVGVIDLDMTKDAIDVKIADEILKSTQPIHGFTYKLEHDYLSSDDFEIENISQNAPDISILKKDNDYYIASNSSEMDINQAAYAYLQIDGEIPENMINNLKLDANTGLSQEGMNELQEAVILQASKNQENHQELLKARNQDKTPSTHQKLG